MATAFIHLFSEKIITVGIDSYPSVNGETFTEGREMPDHEFLASEQTETFTKAREEPEEDFQPHSVLTFPRISRIDTNCHK